MDVEVIGRGEFSRRPQGIRGQEQAPGLQGAPAQGDEQEQGGPDRQRGHNARSAVPDEPEGSQDQAIPALTGVTVK